MKRLLTTLLLTACTAQAVTPTIHINPLPGVMMTAALSLDPASISRLPDTLFSQPVLYWRWLPDYAPDAAAGNFGLPADSRMASHGTGLEAQLAEHDSVKKTTCDTVANEITRLMEAGDGHGVRYFVQCGEKYVWVSVLLGEES